jgi:class 3 adenylate cyclase
MENRLMTIMFLDMQGYTKRSAQQTIEEMKIFHDQMFKFVSDIIDRWNGKMVKSLGDGFMVRFESPTNAVQAGIEVQRKLEARNAQMMNPDSLVRFRIGINTGEVGVDENGDLFGDPVNIASRIQTFADTNDVFISESTFLAMNQNEFGAVDLGAQELKNATREIRIYKVLKNGMPGLMPGHAKSAVSSRKIKIGAIAAIVAIIFLLIVFSGIRMLKRKRAEAEKHKRSNTSQTAQAVREEKTSSLTLLDLKPNDKRLKFDSAESRAFAEVHKMRQAKNYAAAEKICVNMIGRLPGNKKLPWGLILAELFFEQGKKENAEKLSENLLRKEVSPELKERLLEQINRLREKYKDA